MALQAISSRAIRLYRTNNLPLVPPGDPVAVSWQQSEYNPLACWNTLAPSKLFLPPGLWLVGCHVAGLFAEGGFPLEFALTKNGVQNYKAMSYAQPNTAASLVAPVVMAAGDYVELAIRHAIPGNLTLYTRGDVFPALWAVYQSDTPRDDNSSPQAWAA